MLQLPRSGAIYVAQGVSLGKTSAKHEPRSGDISVFPGRCRRSATHLAAVGNPNAHALGYVDCANARRFGRAQSHPILSTAVGTRWKGDAVALHAVVTGETRLAVVATACAAARIASVCSPGRAGGHIVRRAFAPSSVTSGKSTRPRSAGFQPAGQVASSRLDAAARCRQASRQEAGAREGFR